MAKTILEHEALVNIRQYSRLGDKTLHGLAWTIGRTELSWAVDAGHAEMTELLLKHGANPNCANSAGRTPLHFACIRNDHRIVKDSAGERSRCKFPKLPPCILPLAPFQCCFWTYLLLKQGWGPIDEVFSNGYVEIILDYEPLLDVPSGFGASRRHPCILLLPKRIPRS